MSLKLINAEAELVDMKAKLTEIQFKATKMKPKTAELQSKLTELKSKTTELKFDITEHSSQTPLGLTVDRRRRYMPCPENTIKPTKKEHRTCTMSWHVAAHEFCSTSQNMTTEANTENAPTGVVLEKVLPHMTDEDMDEEPIPESLSQFIKVCSMLAEESSKLNGMMSKVKNAKAELIVSKAELTEIKFEKLVEIQSTATEIQSKATELKSDITEHSSQTPLGLTVDELSFVVNVLIPHRMTEVPSFK